MGMIWVAYNECGDLVASAYGYWELVAAVKACGYRMDEVITGRWTP